MFFCLDDFPKLPSMRPGRLRNHPIACPIQRAPYPCYHPKRLTPCISNGSLVVRTPCPKRLPDLAYLPGCARHGPRQNLAAGKKGLFQDIPWTKIKIHRFFTIKPKNNNIFHPYSILIDPKIPEVFATYENRIYKYKFQNLYL